jgi:hypothetical protein
VLLVAENRRIERRLARLGTPPRPLPESEYRFLLALGLLAARRRGLSHLLKQTPPMPLYWLLISAAAYRALWQFMTARFEWEKTERGLP